MRTRPSNPVRRVRRPGMFDGADAASIDLDFRSGLLDPSITFTRTTTGTYRVLGGLASAAINAPRFEQDPITGRSLGMLMEEGSTNLQPASADPSSASWSKLNLTIGGSPITAPDGTASGYLLSATATGVATQFRTGSITITGTNVTGSAFIKKGSLTTVGMSLALAGVIQASASYNFDTGQTSSTGGAVVAVIPVGNGWFRLSMTLTTWTSGGSCRFFIGFSGGSGVTAGDSFYFWGGQLEAKAYPTSYIPTTTTSLARGADSAVMSGVRFSSWFNQDAGTFVVGNSGIIPGASGIALQADDGTADERHSIAVNVGSCTATCVDTGSSQASMTVTPVTQTNAAVHAYAYAKDNFAYSVNGSAVQTDTAGTMPTVNALGIGMTSAGASHLNGPVSFLRYYPFRIQNELLPGLTA